MLALFVGELDAIVVEVVSKALVSNPPVEDIGDCVVVSRNDELLNDNVVHRVVMPIYDYFLQNCGTRVPASFVEKLVVVARDL